MLIRYDHSKLTVEYLMVKSVSTALGGSMRVRNEESHKLGKEVYDRVDVPFAVARRFKQLHKTTKYMTCVLCAIVKYDGRVVAIERARDNQQHVHDFQCVNRIATVIEPLAQSNEFYTDGSMIYGFKNGTAAASSEPLSSDGKFQAVTCNAIQFMDITSDRPLELNERTAVAFNTGSKTVVSPPVWKNIHDVGSNKIVSDDDVNKFDSIDNQLAVNLNFVLYAGKHITEQYDVSEIDCLRFPELMVALNTVNLPQVSASIKNTYDCKMRFTHAVAWILGLLDKAKTFEQFEVCSSLLKYLSKQGIFTKNILTEKSIFKPGNDATTIKMVDIDTLKMSAVQTSLEFSRIAEAIR